MILPKDVIIFPEKGKRWIVMNVFAKSCLAVDTEALAVLQAAGEQSYASAESSERRHRVWEIEIFSNYHGLYADPSRYVRNIEDWPEAEELGVKELIVRFLQHHLLIEDEDSYRAKYSSKDTILDFSNFGNFHQQLGQFLFLEHKQSPEEWWVNQKFTKDLCSVQNNPYGAIQANYLKEYFPRKFCAGDSVLDLGCGLGVFSKLMAQTGATVLGIDPNDTFIETATADTKSNLRFETKSVGTKGALDHISNHSMDYVFMCDVLLFYFVPVESGKEADINVLLDDVRRILKPKGRFIAVEPYLFWLMPWFGEITRPFTIFTEYFDKNFGVTPTTSKFIQTVSEHGFAITWMDELLPSPDFEKVDPRAYHFASQFPLWQIFELQVFS